jgi:hypothetical protein
MTDENEIRQAQAQVLAQEAAIACAKARWGPTDESLPLMTPTEFQEMAIKSKGKRILLRLSQFFPMAFSWFAFDWSNCLLTALVSACCCGFCACVCLPESYVLDASEYAPRHPGGRSYLQAYHGRSIDEAFEGGINLHTNAAHSAAAMMRIARIE